MLSAAVAPAFVPGQEQKRRLAASPYVTDMPRLVRDMVVLMEGEGRNKQPGFW